VILFQVIFISCYYCQYRVSLWSHFEEPSSPSRLLPLSSQGSEMCTRYAVIVRPNVGVDKGFTVLFVTGARGFAQQATDRNRISCNVSFCFNVYYQVLDPNKISQVEWCRWLAGTLVWFSPSFLSNISCPYLAYFSLYRYVTI